MFKMTHIDSTAFGEIVVDGKVYNHDIKILPSGKVVERIKIKGSHLICLEEFKAILDEKPEVIVIGNGQDGIAEVENDAKQQIAARKIKLIIEPTPKAIQTFNKLKNKKAGIFHVTC